MIELWLGHRRDCAFQLFLQRRGRGTKLSLMGRERTAVCNFCNPCLGGILWFWTPSLSPSYFQNGNNQSGLGNHKLNIVEFCWPGLTQRNRESRLSLRKYRVPNLNSFLKSYKYRKGDIFKLNKKCH